jgi:hypothetical protein
MICETEDFRIPDHKRGTTWDGITFLVTEPDDDNVEQPVDYTGCSIVARLKQGKTGSTVLEWKTSDGSIVFGTGAISDPTTGEIVLKKRKIDVPARDYYFELDYEEADQDVYPIIEAWWNITN